MTTRGSRLVTVNRQMLPIVTGLLAGGLHVLAVTQHLHVLAPRAVMLPPRSGTTGGYWGLAQGTSVVMVGLVALLVRRLLGVEGPIESLGFVVGVMMVLVGLTAAYRLSLLQAHDHPHVHDGVEHEHIHLHNTPEQVHDHDQIDFDIVRSSRSGTNLIAVIPALVLTELESILYLVTYLVISILAMGVLGSWLGHARRRDQDRGLVLRFAGGLGYGLAVLGFAWMFLWWPL